MARVTSTSASRTHDVGFLETSSRPRSKTNGTLDESHHFLSRAARGASSAANAATSPRRTTSSVGAAPAKRHLGEETLIRRSEKKGLVESLSLSQRARRSSLSRERERERDCVRSRDHLSWCVFDSPPSERKKSEVWPCAFEEVCARGSKRQ